MQQMDYEKTVEKIRGRLRDYIATNRLRGLVVGISGGIDSAVVAALAAPVCKELEIQLIGRSITIDSNSPEEIARAKAVGDAFCTDFAEIDATNMYQANLHYFEDYAGGELDPIDKGNLKARDRMKILYMLARRNGGLVLSTDNFTELLLGFSTLHGDVGDLGMIQNMWKTDVYNMSVVIANQQQAGAKKAIMDCVEADATDGLGISKTDLDQIIPDWRDRHTSSRSGYSEVDERLKAWMKRLADPNFPSTVITHDPIINRNKATKGKREAPYNFKLEDIAVYV